MLTVGEFREYCEDNDIADSTEIHFGLADETATEIMDNEDGSITLI